MRRLLVLILVLAGCGAALTQERLNAVRNERERATRTLIVCATMFPHNTGHHCNRYRRHLYELTCEEARLEGRECTEIYEPE